MKSVEKKKQIRPLSVVIPFHDEEDNVGPLLEETAEALEGAFDFEIVCIDDGSADRTWQVLCDRSRMNARIRPFRHDRRWGQSAALVSGMKMARCGLAATMDGDGQNDPADISSLLDAFLDLDESPGPSLVVGWRTTRLDSPIKILSSKFANAFRRSILKDDTPDTGCGLKIIRRDVFLSLPFFDHMHRFLPALVLREGGRVKSVPVRHRERIHGKTHYGVPNRAFAGLADTVGVFWLQKRAFAPRLKGRDENDR